MPEGLVQQLTALPSPQQVNHYIIAAMLRPLTNEAGVLGFCDIMESVLEDEQSQAFIEIVRNGMFYKACTATINIFMHCTYVCTYVGLFCFNRNL